MPVRRGGGDLSGSPLSSAYLSQVLGSPRLAFDVGLGSVTAWRHFIVPATILVLVRDAGRLSRNHLLLRCALRRFASQVVGREGLGEHGTHAVSPTAVMFDDLIGDLAHLSLLAGTGVLSLARCFGQI